MREALLDTWLIASHAVRTKTIHGAVSGLAHFRNAMPDRSPSKFGATLVRSVAYGPRAVHKLDVYVPRGDGPFPCVVYIHGGGFSMGSRNTHRVFALKYVEAGALVFNVDYRLAPFARFPEPLDDVSRALLWVQKNASRFGADLSRLAIAGESAGGNLALTLSLACSAKLGEASVDEVFEAGISPRAVLPAYGYFDLTEGVRLAAVARGYRYTQRALVGTAHSYLGRRWRKAREVRVASPLRLLEDGLELARPFPPTFLTCGTRDPLLGQTRRLDRELRRRGVLTELFVADGEIHGYDAFLSREKAVEKWGRAQNFVRTQLDFSVA